MFLPIVSINDRMLGLEFSYDRSKDSTQRRAEAQPQPQQQPPQASSVRPGPDLNTVDPSTIANERLRKAIERNRAKQAARDMGRPEVQPQSATVQESQHQQASFFSEPQPQPQVQAQVHVQPQAQPQPQMAQETTYQETPRVRVRENLRTDPPPPPPRESTVVSRRSVAKPEDTEFVPVKRATRKVASQISYTTTSSRKKSKSVDPKYTNYLVKGCWAFCAIMVLRLIFANGGVTDFYSQKATVNERLGELSDIKKENMQLVREIERMRSDTGFQKKLVRDNLGFIANDEFLVLFPTTAK